MKKYIFLILFLILIFAIFYYKNFINGNNIISKNQEEIIESILSENVNYNAEMKVTVYSNKNEHIYKLKQEEKDNYSYQKVISSGDIEGLLIEIKENKLYIKNTKLKLEKIYEDYKEVTNDYLFLRTFGKEYKESSENVKKFEENEEIVVKMELKNSNKYIKYKELYIDKNTGYPKKLIIKNSDKQVIVCIEYTNIEIM